MLNQCVLTGNLGDDPVIHYTSEGMAVASFNLAFNSSYNRKKQPSWIKVNCFSKLGEICGLYLHKGARVAVVGVLEQHKWQNEDGQNRSNFELNCNTIEFIKTDGRGFKEGETQEAINDDVPF